MLRRVKSVAPGFFVAQPLLARALQLQQRHAEAFAEIEDMLKGPSVSAELEKWQKDILSDSLTCARELLTALGRKGEVEGFSLRMVAQCVVFYLYHLFAFSNLSM